MTLSVCMIIRNEAAHLPGSLASIRELADEICVLDTGSSDASFAIACEHGARVEHFTWCDDFAAAINANCAMARGDWILRLDADEQLLPESIALLRAALNDDSAFMQMLLRRDLTTLGPPEQFTEMYVDRLFRRRSDVVFIGRCHARPTIEWGTLASRSKQRVALTSIVLRHTGYLGPMREAKLRRGAKLMELELAERPGQLYYLAELGRTLLQLGEMRGHTVMHEAMELVLAHASDARPPQPIAALVLEHALLTDAAHRPAGLDEAMLESLLTRWFPHAAPLWWTLAKLHFDRQHFAPAAAALERLLQLKDGYDRSISFDSRLIGDDAAFNLAVCYAHLGRLEESIALFDSLQRSPTRGASAAQNLSIVQQLRASS